MRYYCKECNSGFALGEEIDLYKKYGYDKIGCMFCHSFDGAKIPQFETPAQYKERTGKEWQGAVWYRPNPLTKGWNVSNIKSLYLIFGSEFKDIPILCASQPCAPPDDWMEVSND